ncbi:MAG: hypothetical protein WED27_04600 [Pirellulales bacterium]
MRCLSFSLWGDDPVYTAGAVCNADLAAALFPGWTCIVACYRSVPRAVVCALESRANVEVRRLDADLADGDSRGMFARMLIAGEPIECMICRDADSRLSQRERLAVDDWLARGTDLHVMRDHPFHGVPIPGGMWGVRGGRLTDIGRAIAAFAPTALKGQDQAFLADWVWGRVRRGELSCTVHDPFFAARPFPRTAARGAANGGVWFVGQCFDENDRWTSRSDIDAVLKAERAVPRWKRLRSCLRRRAGPWG